MASPTMDNTIQRMVAVTMCLRPPDAEFISASPCLSCRTRRCAVRATGYFDGVRTALRRDGERARHVAFGGHRPTEAVEAAAAGVEALPNIAARLIRRDERE